MAASRRLSGLNPAVAPRSCEARRSSSSSIARSRAGKQDDGIALILPTRFESFLSGYPCCACSLLFGLAFFGVVLTGCLLQAKVVTLSTESVWEVLGDPVVKQMNAFRQAKRGSSTASISSVAVPATRSRLLDQLYLVYEVQEGSVFDQENLDKIRKVEHVLVASTEWPRRCLLSYNHAGNESRCRGGTTPLGLVARGREAQRTELRSGFGPCGGDPDAAGLCESSPFEIGSMPCTSSVHNPLDYPFDSDRQRNLRCICCAMDSTADGCRGLECGNDAEQMVCGSSIKSSRQEAGKFFAGSDFSCVDGSTKRTRSTYQFGYPLAKDAGDGNLDDLKKWTAGSLLRDLFRARDEVADGNFQVYVSGAGTQEAFFQDALMKDQLLAVGSVLSVFFWLWTATGSVFLAVCGMGQIIFSLPLAMLMWAIVDMEYITFFMLTIVFLVLGIGADDIFVLWDAYQQAESHFQGQEGVTPAMRFAWALRRARSAMAVTSATTFFGLMAAGTTAIPSVSAFGIFGALVILFDYLLVITFFAAAVQVYDQKLKYRHGVCGRLQASCTSCCTSRAGEGEARDTLRGPERFFRDTWAPAIDRFKVHIAVFWAAMFLASGCTAGALLRPTQESPQFFRDAYGTRWFELIAESDGFEGTRTSLKRPVAVVVGIDRDDPLDRSGINYQNPEERGTPRFDRGAVELLDSAKGQLALWNLCHQARSGHMGRVSRDVDCETELVGTAPRVRIEKAACQTGAVCFIDWVRDYRMEALNRSAEDWHHVSLSETLRSGAFFPGASAEEVSKEADFECGACCRMHGWYVCKMHMTREYFGMQDVADWLDMSRWYMEDGKLKWAYVSMNSTLPLKMMALEDIEEQYDDWKSFVDQHAGSLGAFQTEAMWAFAVMQKELLKSVYQSIGACLLLAWLVLCAATLNWIVATISLSCIASILVIFAAFLPICGFELGIFEGVGLIVVVGLSVDYTVHIGHSFNETRYLDGQMASRKDKTTHALTEMGISIACGSATTFLASLFLLPAKFMFYHVFGIFMMVTVTVSTLVALSLLPALLLLFGPVGTSGDLVWLRSAFAWAGERLATSFGSQLGGRDPRKTMDTE